METLPKINAKLTDKAGQIIKDCLGTSVILREVLQYFYDDELLKLSLVNKQWSLEARSLLRTRGDLVARVGSDDLPSCQDLEAFASDLPQMRDVPFFGVHVKLSHPGGNTCKPTPSGPIRYKEILELLSWKILSIEFCDDDWAICKDCPALAFVTKVLQDFSGVLEEISLNVYGEGAEEVDLVCAAVHSSFFPRLKALNLELDTYGGPMPFNELAKTLVTRAPNLKKLHIMGTMDLNDEDILKGSSAELVPPWHFNPLYGQVCQSLIGKLRATEMRIHSDPSLDFNVEVLERFVPAVLQASHTTMTALWMDLFLALPLMCYGICLENVTTLRILFNSCGYFEILQPQPWLNRLLRGFNFSSVFPKLNRVHIQAWTGATISPIDVMGFGNQGIAVFRNTLPDENVRIKHMTLTGSFMDWTPTLWAEMFPHVQTIRLGEMNTRGIPFKVMWEHFIHLRELRVKITAKPEGVDNMDCALCGIFPEEVAELREKDDEYLKAVNIVPVMPSITCMKDLRTVAVQFRYIDERTLMTEFHQRSQSNNLPIQRAATFMFSKVTGLIGFARCPNLAVTFQTPSREYAEALSHMKPYVTFED